MSIGFDRFFYNISFDRDLLVRKARITRAINCYYSLASNHLAILLGFSAATGINDLKYFS